MENEPLPPAPRAVLPLPRWDAALPAGRPAQLEHGRVGGSAAELTRTWRRDGRTTWVSPAAGTWSEWRARRTGRSCASTAPCATSPRPPSPQAPRPTAGAGRFVVQRHRARRLHYDLRLEIDGVLASWAVPEGPVARPGGPPARRPRRGPPAGVLDFEGVIPRGAVRRRRRRSSGTAARGRPSHTDDPAAAIAAGELHFDLTGEKLAGRFVLVRRTGRTAGRSSGCCSTRTTSTPGTAGTPTTTRGR